MKCCIVQATADTGSQPFTNSGVFGGEVPKAAIILSSIATANDTPTATVNQVIGFVAATTQGGISIQDNDATTPNTASYANYSSQVYSMAGSGGPTTGDATGSMIANGVQLGWTDDSSTELISALLLGGDLEAYVSAVTGNGSTSQTGVAHGLTAAPEWMMLLTTGHANSLQAKDNAKYGIGFWTAGAQQCLGAQLSQHNVATINARAQISSTKAIVNKANSPGFTWTGAISNVGATTFDLTWSSGHTAVVYVLAVRSTSGSMDAQSGTFATQTSTGTNADISGMSVAPQVVLYALSRAKAVDTEYTAGDDASVAGLGVAVKNSSTGATQYAVAVSSDEDSESSVNNHAYSQSSAAECIKVLDASNGTADIQATVNSWDAGGVTHNYSNVNATAREVMYLAFGAEVAASSAPRARMLTMGVG